MKTLCQTQPDEPKLSLRKTKTKLLLLLLEQLVQVYLGFYQLRLFSNPGYDTKSSKFSRIYVYRELQ